MALLRYVQRAERLSYVFGLIEETGPAPPSAL